MKKLMLIAAACVALASCVKNEVEPVVVDNSPIGFQAVQSLEQTRALGDFTGPDFVSYAYLLQKDQEWDHDKATAQLFFAGQVVTESTVDTDADGVFEWTTATAYYWPEQGSLTFYAYSPSSITSPTVPSSVTTDGMKFIYNDDTYTNVDFM
ncbi:MAG: fimbrillin family protein, partial [Tidjanibacter sp.]|nr:fimbrillin family protein [Tidjanibacter sp.]